MCRIRNITLYNYIPLSQVKNKNIVLVIFVISQKQQQLFPINIVSLTYKFIFAKSQMCHPFYIISEYLHINVLNHIRSEDQQSTSWLEPVCRTQKYNSNYIPLSQVFSSDHSFFLSLRYEVGYNPLPELCFPKHK